MVFIIPVPVELVFNRTFAIKPLVGYMISAFPTFGNTKDCENWFVLCMSVCLGSDKDSLFFNRCHGNIRSCWLKSFVVIMYSLKLPLPLVTFITHGTSVTYYISYSFEEKLKRLKINEWQSFSRKTD